MKKVIFLLLDGARRDALENHIANGFMPNLRAWSNDLHFGDTPEKLTKKLSSCLGNRGSFFKSKKKRPSLSLSRGLLGEIGKLCRRLNECLRNFALRLFANISFFGNQLGKFREYCKFLLTFAKNLLFSLRISRNFVGISGNPRRS